MCGGGGYSCYLVYLRVCVFDGFGGKRFGYFRDFSFR